MTIFCSPYGCPRHWTGGELHDCLLGPRPNRGEIVVMILIAAVSFIICLASFDWGILARLAVSLVISLVSGFGSFVVWRTFIDFIDD